MDDVTQKALGRLRAANRSLTPQQFKTLRGQILAGNAEQAMKGLNTLLERRKAHATATR